MKSTPVLADPLLRSNPTSDGDWLAGWPTGLVTVQTIFWSGPSFNRVSGLAQSNALVHRGGPSFHVKGPGGLSVRPVHETICCLLLGGTRVKAQRV
jgi:hypothetical protein